MKALICILPRTSTLWRGCSAGSKSATPNPPARARKQHGLDGLAPEDDALPREQSVKMKHRHWKIMGYT